MAEGRGPTPSAGDEKLHLRMLGPLRLWRGGAEVDAGPRQQAYLLALLLAQVGRPISKWELIDLIWGEDPPETALNVIHKYIGALRRLFEPRLPARASGSYLLRRGDSYLCTADAGTLDLARFRELVGAAQVELDERRHERALDHFVAALELWCGSTGEGFVHGSAATAMFAGVDGEFFATCTTTAELAVSLDRPERVLLPLHLAATMAPLHEPVQASLVRALGAAGRQSEALSMFRTVHARLADELGIAPGPALEAAHRHVLTQTAVPATEPVAPTPSEAPTEPGPARTDVMVGRTAELAALRATVQRVVEGSSELVLVEGEPGAGKTRLLAEIATEAGRRDAVVVWGHCLDAAGAPSMWPWVQVIGPLVENLDTEERQAWLDGDLGRLLEPVDDAVPGQTLPEQRAQFRLFDRVVSLVGELARRRPVIIIIDDLHWADDASLQLVDHLATRLPDGTAIIGALRDRAPRPSSGLARTLAAVSRVAAHRRLRLGPLGPTEVAQLVHRETGHDPGPDTARRIHARTEGNPLFVRELSRMLASSGVFTEDAVARIGVPSSVRDLVRHRMDGLDEDVVDLLRSAAVAGTDIDLPLLSRVTDLDIPTCLAHLDGAEALGLVGPVRGNPFSWRFTHDLVRESILETTPPRRATRLHLRVADALERSAPDEESLPERVAAHLWAAGPLPDPSRTATALVRAGRRAAAKSAFDAAERALRSAAQVARTAGLREVELMALSQLTAVVGMQSMYRGAAQQLLERAEHLARGLGREAEAAGFLYSRFASYTQGIELDRSAPLARRLLEQSEASSDPTVRTYGLQAWGIQQWDFGNIGEALRYLSQSGEILLTGARYDEDPVRRDLELLMTGMLAETTALHGDVDEARTWVKRLEAAGDDRYAVTVWATFATRIAALVGDPVAALRAAERGIAVDPEFSYVFLGTYQRLAQHWALAVTGHEPAGHAAAAERIVEANLLDPVRSCVATWYALIGEMRLAAGALDDAEAALDQARHYLETYGQRYPEGLLLLLRARLLQARGEPDASVLAAVEQTRTVAARQEALLFVRRADDFLGELHAMHIRR
jgi:DNA-binding SARP family transcriptional activator/tetratricopeptide (TPR) repeat protein